MLGHRLRQWPNIKPTPGYRHVFFRADEGMHTAIIDVSRLAVHHIILGQMGFL